MADIAFGNHKFDNSDVVFFKKQLEFVSSRVIDELDFLAPLDYMQYIPVSTEMPVGATQFTWTELSGTGRAKIISDNAMNIPSVSIGGRQHSIEAKMLALGYDYSKMEILRARFAGVPLESRKIKRVMRGIQELINDLAWVGDEDHGIQGFIMYPGTTEVPCPDGAEGTTDWASKTPDEILSDLNDLINGVQVTTNWIERPNMVLLDPLNFQLISQLQKSDASDTTVLEWFLRNNPGISVVPVRKMTDADTRDSVPGDTENIAIAYVKDSEHLEFHLPMSYDSDEPIKNGLTVRVNSYAIAAGVVVYLPLSVAWMSGI